MNNLKLYKQILISFLLILVSSTGFSKIWILSDANLEIRLNDQNSLLSVTDKRCNKTWEQSGLNGKFAISKTVQNKNVLTVNFSGDFLFEVVYSLTESSALEIQINAGNEISIDEFAFPAAFKTPDKNHFILMTDGEGLLLPADDKEYPMSNGATYYTGGGLAMAWMGVVDKNLDAGYMAILETPYDAGLQTGERMGW